MSDQCPECGCKHGCVCDYDVPTNSPAPSSLAATAGSDAAFVVTQDLVNEIVRRANA